MENVSLWAAFVAGLASFFTPCVLPLVPVYLANLAGPEIFEGGAGVRRSLLLHTLFFVLGIGLVFTASGALVGLAGVSINPSSSIVRYVSGGLLVFFGLFMLLASFVPALNFERRLSPQVGAKTGYARSFIIGATFTVAWTPCLSATLGGVLTIAANSDTVGRGAFLLAIYSLGMALPFLLVGAFFSALAPLLKRIGRFSRWIYLGSGALLLIAGILILLGKLSFLYLNN
jgi:cytochrome c-type biogenesis protein